MTPESLAAHRKQLELTQAGMADLLGLSLRGYQKIEAGESPIQTIHLLAIESISLRIAVERKRPMLAFAPTRKLALELARIITEE